MAWSPIIPSMGHTLMQRGIIRVQCQEQNTALPSGQSDVVRFANCGLRGQALEVNSVYDVVFPSPTAWLVRPISPTHQQAADYALVLLQEF